MTVAPKTWVVECYVPDVDDAAGRRAADQAAAAVRGFREGTHGDPGEVEYLGALLMAVDEVVLHAFRAADIDLVRRVSSAAGLPFERVIESVEVLPMPLIRPAGQPTAAPTSLLQPKEVPS